MSTSKDNPRIIRMKAIHPFRLRAEGARLGHKGEVKISFEDWAKALNKKEKNSGPYFTWKKVDFTRSENGEEEAGENSQEQDHTFTGHSGPISFVKGQECFLRGITEPPEVIKLLNEPIKKLREESSSSQFFERLKIEIKSMNIVYFDWDIGTLEFNYCIHIRDRFEVPQTLGAAKKIHDKLYASLKNSAKKKVDPNSDKKKEESDFDNLFNLINTSISGLVTTSCKKKIYKERCWEFLTFFSKNFIYDLPAPILPVHTPENEGFPSFASELEGSHLVPNDPKGESIQKAIWLCRLGTLYNSYFDWQNTYLTERFAGGEHWKRGALQAPKQASKEQSRYFFLSMAIIAESSVSNICDDADSKHLYQQVTSAYDMDTQTKNLIETKKNIISQLDLLNNQQRNKINLRLNVAIALLALASSFEIIDKMLPKLSETLQWVFQGVLQWGSFSLFTLGSFILIWVPLEQLIISLPKWGNQILTWLRTKFSKKTNCP